MPPDSNPYAAIPTDGPPLPGGAGFVRTTPTWFVVSPLKLVVMSLCTLNLYLLYWHHEQWTAIKRRRGDNISPLGRAIFSIFFTHKLFGEVAGGAGQRVAALNPGLWATAYVGIVIAGRLMSRTESGLGLIGFAAPLVLIPIQRELNIQAREADPTADLNETFTGLNFVVLAVGSCLFALVLVGTFLA